MKPVRIVAISDTHGRQRDMRMSPIPEGDILIHAGDLCGPSKIEQYYDVNRFFQEQKNFKHKIFIAGNHDRDFEHSKDLAKGVVHSAIYLQDQFVECMGLKIYGAPWQPEFCNWAFNLPRNGKKLKAAWDMIPEDTDVLVTHGPPYGILDSIVPSDPTSFGGPLGCELLRERVEKVKPLVHIFGHIHGGYGAKMIDGTLFVNAAICTEQYEPLNKPVVFDVVPRKK